MSLGTLGGLGDGKAVAVNGSGEVVGYSPAPSGYDHAFAWTAASGMTDLGSFSTSSYATDVNDSGEVVGYSMFPPGCCDEHAFSWTPAGGLVDLNPPGASISEAAAVNDAGQVLIDTSATSLGVPAYAYLYTPGSGFKELGPVPDHPGPGSAGNALNGPGEAVGVSTAYANFDNYGAAWLPDGTTVDLGLLPGGSGTSPAAVNDEGEVVGLATVDGSEVGFEWTPATGLTEIRSGPAVAIDGEGDIAGRNYYLSASGTLSDIGFDIWSSPEALNDNGEVVGQGCCFDGHGHAEAWTPTGGAEDLGTLGSGPNSAALAVNDDGLVVGWSQSDGGYLYPTVWRTAPPDDDLALADVPADVTTDATSPSGALVTYPLPVPVDEDGPQKALVGCESAPGSTFPVGTTTVTCTATDDDDSDGPASSTFTVTVEGAAAQLEDLASAVVGVGAGSSLTTKVEQAEIYASSSDTAGACSTLNALVNELNAQSGKKMPSAQAQMLVAATEQIEAVMGC